MHCPTWKMTVVSIFLLVPKTACCFLFLLIMMFRKERTIAISSVSFHSFRIKLCTKFFIHSSSENFLVSFLALSSRWEKSLQQKNLVHCFATCWQCLLCFIILQSKHKIKIKAKDNKHEVLVVIADEDCAVQ